MVPGEDHDVLRVVAANDIEVLGHRISGAAVPVFTVNTLLAGRRSTNSFISSLKNDQPALNMLHQVCD